LISYPIYILTKIFGPSNFIYSEGLRRGMLGVKFTWKIALGTPPRHPMTVILGSNFGINFRGQL